MPDRQASQLGEIGQGRAPNTLKLRQKYQEFVIEQQTQGNEVPSFEEWAKKNFPDTKILKM